MTAKDLILEVRNYCENNANEEIAKKSSRFFKEEFVGYGLSALMIVSKTKSLLRENNLNLETVIEASNELMKSEKFEEASFALMLIDGLSKQFSTKTFEFISTSFDFSIKNWAHADTLAMYILPKFVAKKIIEIDDFNSWLRSEHKFKRRCVPVTLIKSLKTVDNPTHLFEFVEALMSDNDRVVHQGMGWFLKKAWQAHPIATEDFLHKWKDMAPRLIISYACEKMTKEDKIKFKKSR